MHLGSACTAKPTAVNINKIIEVSGASIKVLYFGVKGRTFQLKQFR
jgi:hypothetical protein